MWQRVLRSHGPDDDRDRFVIAPHHPDRLRRPIVIGTADERFQQALIWNIFRTGAWFAGARQHFCGVLECRAVNTSFGSVLRNRYARSRDSGRLRSATRGPATPSRVQWGVIQWSELTALLQDCCDAANLPPVERALAQNAVEWVGRKEVL